MLDRETIDVEENGWQDLYGMSHSSNFVKTIELPIQPGQKKLQFCEEVKIRLPFNLGEKHHLFFHFYNVNMKQKKPDDPKEEILGYGILPLTKNGRFKLISGSDRADSCF